MKVLYFYRYESLKSIVDLSLEKFKNKENEILIDEMYSLIDKKAKDDNFTKHAETRLSIFKSMNDASNNINYKKSIILLLALCVIIL